MTGLRPLLLNLDGALVAQTEFLAHAREEGARTIEAADLGPSLRLWTRPPAFAELRHRLRETPTNGGDIVFAGSGDFHHVTLLLLSRAIEAASDPPTTLLHFDNHPDWVKFDNGVHCGSWAARATRLQGVHSVLSVGLCSNDLDASRRTEADLSIFGDGVVQVFPFHAPGGAASLRVCGREWPSIAALGEDAFADLLAEQIETPALYITVDKDVLRGEDAVTNWDQGVTRLDFLLRLIERACGKAKLIGADVVGDWSPQRYGRNPNALLKRAEALMDQPWRRPAQPDADRVNARTNLALLRAFREFGA